MNCIPVVINAFQTRRKYEQSNGLVTNQPTSSSATYSLNASKDLVDEEEHSMMIDKRPSVFLDFARAANHGKFPDRIVNDVKSLRKAIIVFSLLIPYWIIYNQVRLLLSIHRPQKFFCLFQLSSTFTVQATYMYGSEKRNMIAYMWLGDPITIISKFGRLQVSSEMPMKIFCGN